MWLRPAGYPETVDSMTSIPNIDIASPAPLPGCFEHITGWLTASEADQLLGRLTEAVAWEQKHGSFGPQPRLSAWFGSTVYRYSGTINHPMPWLPELDDLRRRLEEATAARYNSCLANLYRTGRDSVAWHADDETTLGARPTIASVSLGATRDFILKRTDGTGLVRIPLSHGDLLVMRDESQIDWRHCLPKRAAVTTPRINLTFRWLER